MGDTVCVCINNKKRELKLSGAAESEQGTKHVQNVYTHGGLSTFPPSPLMFIQPPLTHQKPWVACC